MTAFESLERINPDVYATCTQRLAFEMLTVYANRELESLHARAAKEGYNLSTGTPPPPPSWRQLIRSGQPLPPELQHVDASNGRPRSSSDGDGGSVLDTRPGMDNRAMTPTAGMIEGVKLARPTVFDSPHLEDLSDEADATVLSGAALNFSSRVQAAMREFLLSFDPATGRRVSPQLVTVYKLAHESGRWATEMERALKQRRMLGGRSYNQKDHVIELPSARSLNERVLLEASQVDFETGCVPLIVVRTAVALYLHMLLTCCATTQRRCPHAQGYHGQRASVAPPHDGAACAAGDRGWRGAGGGRGGNSDQRCEDGEGTTCYCEETPSHDHSRRPYQVHAQPCPAHNGCRGCLGR